MRLGHRLAMICRLSHPPVPTLFTYISYNFLVPAILSVKLVNCDFVVVYSTCLSVLVEESLVTLVTPVKRVCFF